MIEERWRNNERERERERDENIWGGKMAEGVEIGEKERDRNSRNLSQKHQPFAFSSPTLSNPSHPFSQARTYARYRKPNLKPSFRYVC